MTHNDDYNTDGDTKMTILPMQEIKPPVPDEERLRRIILTDAITLTTYTPSQMAYWLQHFDGYDTNQLKAIEIETFIDYDTIIDGAHWDFAVWVGGSKGYGFKTEGEAYQFFCEHYNEITGGLDDIIRRTS